MDDADIQASVVSWLSFVVTTIGLGGLITQASAINDQMDPFHATRNSEYLGVWYKRQNHFPWWRIAKPAPQGPVVAAKLPDGFCGFNTIYVMRIPPVPPGKAGWSTVLAMFHSEQPLGPMPRNPSDSDAAEKASVSTYNAAVNDCALDGWPFLQQKPLTRHNADACITISRRTLIIMLIMINGRVVFKFSDATGFRAGYGSYVGQWYITWPIGQEAVLKFAPHDSLGSSEFLPRFFPQRIDRCCEIVCGVVSAPSDGLKVAFCGRKAPGLYKLEYGRKGFQGAHGARHLYNILGGKAHEIDFMYARPLHDDQSPAASVVLTLPSREKNEKVQMIIPPEEEEILKHAMDCLPWTSLSWSIHRGLRDIMVTYAKPVMDAHRREFADRLLKTVQEKPHLLQARGWETEFVRDTMGHMASSAVLAGVGNSGDSVRVVTDIVSVMLDEWDVQRLDVVKFWRRPEIELDADGIIALTKIFVLEWSQEFDYQVYHQIPLTLYFG